MRARTLDSPRPSIFDALGEKYSELARPEPGEAPRRKRSRFAAVVVFLVVAAGAVAYFVDAARTPPRREVGEISLFQPAASLPPGVVIPSPEPPRATKARTVPPLPPVKKPAASVPVREKEAEPLPSLPAPPPSPAPAMAAPRPAPVPPPEAPALETEESVAETVPPPESLPQLPTEDVQVPVEDSQVSAEGSQVPAEVVPVEPAVKVFSPPPAYPQADWVAAIEGDVSLEATIDAEGRVASVEVLQGVSPGLDAAAVRALRRWRYHPATRGGEAVSSVQRLTFRFRR